MNAEERTLIAGLFERLRGSETAYRDPDADAFIREQVAAQPHAPYAMAQTVIVQNQALEAAQAKIAELERRLEAPRDAASVEPAPWGPRANAAMGAPAGFGAGALAGGQPTFGVQPPAYGAAPVGQQQPARGGGFMSGALQTAAGVAGGALLFTGIQSMFGGGQADAAKPAEPESAAEAAAPAETADASAADGGGEGGGWFSGLFGGDGSQTADAGAPDDGGGDDWA